MSLASADTLVVVALFVSVAMAEMLYPSRTQSGPTGRRWFGNLLLYAVSSGLLMLPVIAGLVAALTAQHAWVSPLDWLALPAPLQLAISILVLDAVNYAQHRLSHNVGFLWRIHAVHHSDPNIDVTTTLRHHPLEMLLAVAMLGGAALAIGMSATDVLLYGWLAWAVQLPAHANIALPPWLDAPVRRILVTPAFHQVHHSRRQDDTDSNYGQVFAFWDTLFRSARHRRAGSQHDGSFGLDEFRDARSQSLPSLLVQPLLPRAPQVDRIAAG